MKCCVSTDVGTWTNWLTFAPDPDYSPDARTGLLSPILYKRYDMELYYVWKIQRICIRHPSLRRCMVLKWFYSSESWGHLCWRYMRSTECTSSSSIQHFHCYSFSVPNVMAVVILCRSWSTIIPNLSHATSNDRTGPTRHNWARHASASPAH